jgi:hypothetical protein
LDKLRGFLRPEIEQGLVTVLGTDAAPVVRVRNRGMFTAGSASVASKFNPLLERIGQALAAEHGSVQVIGYTDNQPIRSLQFPSNFQLSAARAKAAAAIIGKAIGKPSLGYVHAPNEQLRGAMVQMGMSANFVDLILEMAGALNSGHMKALEARSAKNSTATTFEKFVEEEFAPAYREQVAA